MAQINIEEKAEIIEALKGFEKAYTRLVGAWYDANVELTEDYPFEQSFDEYDVHQWVKSSLDELEKIKALEE